MHAFDNQPLGGNGGENNTPQETTQTAVETTQPTAETTAPVESTLSPTPEQVQSPEPTVAPTPQTEQTSVPSATPEQIQTAVPAVIPNQQPEQTGVPSVTTTTEESENNEVTKASAPTETVVATVEPTPAEKENTEEPTANPVSTISPEMETETQVQNSPTPSPSSVATSSPRPDKTESEPEYIDGTQKVSTSHASITVSFDKNAKLPEGSVLKANEYAKGTEQYQTYIQQAENTAGVQNSSGYVFDIRFEKDNQKIEPQSDVTVSVSLKDASFTADNIHVVHFKGNNGIPENVSGVTAGGKKSSKESSSVSFQTDSFSIYSIIIEEHPTQRFDFWNGDKLYREVILKDKETLSVPENPSAPEGKTFTGWYSDKEGNNKFEQFNQPINKDNGITDLYAGFANETVKIIYHYADSIITTDTITKGSDYTFHNSYPAFKITQESANGIMVCNGWTTDKSNTSGTTVYNDNDTVKVNKDIDLYPVIESRYLVDFHSDGGTQTDSVYVEEGKNLEKPDDPKREGYTFAGWYTDSQYTNSYNFDTPVTANLDLYARWDKKQVKYTIVYWKQTVSGAYELAKKTAENAESGTWKWADYNEISGANSYDFASFTTGEAYVETPLSGINYNKNKYPVGFHLNENKTDSDADGKRVAGDGQSVKNVYYDRNIFKIKWMVGNNDRLDVPTVYGDTYGHAWWHNNDMKNGQKSYGDIIDDLSKNGNEYQLWEEVGIRHGWENWYGKYRLVGSNAGYQGNNHAEYEMNRISPHVYHKYAAYFEKLDENEQVPLADSGLPEGTEELSKEKLDQNIIYNRVYQEQNCTSSYRGVRIDGFTLDHIENAKPLNADLKGDQDQYGIDGLPYSGKTGEFYYTRNKYNIDFIENGGNELAEIHDVSYQAKLDEYEPEEYTSKEADGIKYKFMGWFDNQACVGEPFNFSGSRMPAHNLILYAKWEPETFTVTFNPNGGILANKTKVDDLDSVKVSYGENVTKPADPIPPENSEQQFLGWTLDGRTFPFSSPINRDITLMALYSGTNTYQVTYDANGGTGNVPSDNGKYLVNGKAVVMDGSDLRKDGNKVVAWSTEKNGGILYYPGESFLVKKDITLYAQYGNKLNDTKIKYDFNPGYNGYKIDFGSVNSKTVDLLNNSTLTVNNKAGDNTVSDNGFTAMTDVNIPDGYKFMGWSLKQDGTKPVPEKILLDNDDHENVVYAIWHKYPDIKVSKVWNDGNNSAGKRPESVTVRLLSNGEDTGKTLTLSAQNNWTGVFENVPDITEDNQPLDLTVEEDQVDDYQEEKSGNVESGFTFTNTLLDNITIRKSWADDNDSKQERPDYVIVHLLANQNVNTATLNEGNNWQSTFENMPLYDGAGKKIIYSVSEDPVNDYSLQINQKDGSNDFDLTNVLVPDKTDINVMKKWVDDENAAHTRPQNITVHLLKNGEETGRSLTLNSENNWAGVFTEVDTDGKYTVREDPVNGYNSSYSVDENGNMIITNTRTESPALEKTGFGDPSVVKMISGDKPETKSVFSFRIEPFIGQENNPMPEDENGNIRRTVMVTGEGSAEFGIITFTKPGTYDYTISEVNCNASGYTYDSSLYHVQYVVSQTEQKYLTVQRTISRTDSPDINAGDTAVFVNQYSKADEPVVPEKQEDPKSPDTSVPEQSEDRIPSEPSAPEQAEDQVPAETFVPDQTITDQTDHTDIPVTDSNDTPVVKTEEKNTEKPKQDKENSTESADTSDTNKVGIYGTLTVFALIVAAAVIIIRKKEDRE